MGEQWDRVKLTGKYKLTKSAVSAAEKYFIVFMLKSINPLVDWKGDLPWNGDESSKGTSNWAFQQGLGEPCRNGHQI